MHACTRRELLEGGSFFFGELRRSGDLAYPILEISREHFRERSPSVSFLDAIAQDSKIRKCSVSMHLPRLHNLKSRLQRFTRHNIRLQNS
ncbi:hypothetical protein VNO77_03249 [Canavalia gladiata]|uniref:Uncharacterized protein n=1 Tax=Canavalia gladiata TaxID=3824 RepID=A0AAN9R6N1_CANGL